jgi:hypothetical protein
MEVDKQALFKVLHDYAVPDPKIVGKLPKGGIQLDFVGHADITRILIEIDPCWRWVPIAWENGRPLIHVENGMATMWGELTLLGQARLGVGSCRSDKADLDKELVSDFLRNAAMRFGIALSLWTKQEWEDLGGKPAPEKKVVLARPNKPVDADTMAKFLKACDDASIDYEKVADLAGVTLESATDSDMAKLRVAFKELRNQ